MTSGPKRAGDLQNGLRIGHFVRIDARECAIDQVRPDFLLQVVVAPVEEMFQDQHPNHDLRGRPWSPAATALRPPRLERLRHHLNHRFVLEQRIDTPQPVGPQFVSIGQQHFEETALALSASDHARSFGDIGACSVRNMIRTAQTI